MTTVAFILFVLATITAGYEAWKSHSLFGLALAMLAAGWAFYLIPAVFK